MEHIDGGAHLVAARDRAVAAVVHAFGRGRLDDDACATLLDEVQAAPDVATLDQLLERIGAAPLPATRPLMAEDLVAPVGAGPGTTATAAGPVDRRLDAVDLALAARARQGGDRRRDPRMVSLVVVVAVLVVLAVLGMVLISAVRTDVPGSTGSPGAAPAPSAGLPGAPAGTA